MQRDYRTAGFVRLCFEKLLPLMVLNLLFLLTCLPVLTAPAGWTALCRACQSLLLEEKQPVPPLSEQLPCQFSPVASSRALFFAGPAAILYGGWFYFRLTEGAGVGAVLACFCLIGSYLLWCIGALAFQMQARVELKLPALLKNAICLAFRCPALVLGWLLLALALTAVMALLLPYSLPWLALLGGRCPALRRRGARCRLLTISL